MVDDGDGGDLPGILVDLGFLTSDNAAVGSTALVAALRQTIVRQEQARRFFLG